MVGTAPPFNVLSLFYKYNQFVVSVIFVESIEEYCPLEMYSGWLRIPQIEEYASLLRCQNVK